MVPAESLLTIEDYKQLKKRPAEAWSLLDASAWGTCTPRADALRAANLTECGLPGGICGAQACPANATACTEG